MTAERNELSDKVANLRDEMDEGAKTPECFARFVGKWQRVYESNNWAAYKKKFGKGFLGWKTYFYNLGLLISLN